MSYIRQLYKLFNLNSISTEDEIEENNNNNSINQETKEKTNYNILEDIKDDVFDDINEDFINPNNFKTNRYSQITSINLPQNLLEDKQETEPVKNKRISLDIIKDIPKYNRIKTNRNDCYYTKRQEEDYNEIIKDFLYISSYKTASTVTDLKNLKITNIINCSGDLCENLTPESSLLNIDYLTLNIRDNVSENIESLFFKCINYINKVKENNGRVLIHCYKGVSRSVSIVIAYLIYLYRWTYDEAFDFVQSKRSIANPNIGFYLQLKTFHKRLTLENDRLEIFAVSHFCPEQHDLIVCRLIYNNICLKNLENKKNKNNIEEDEINDEDIDEDVSVDESVDKKEIILNEKGMFIFAMQKKIFIVEGKNISENNYELYKKNAIEYIREIQKFEKIGKETDSDNVEIIKQNEIETKYNELINEHNIIIKFSDTKIKLIYYSSNYYIL